MNRFLKAFAITLISIIGIIVSVLIARFLISSLGTIVTCCIVFPVYFFIKFIETK